MKILSWITSFLAQKSIVHLWNTNEDIFDQIWELSDPAQRKDFFLLFFFFKQKYLNLCPEDEERSYRFTELKFSGELSF